MRYSLSPERNTRRVTCTSLYAKGSLPSWLSIRMETSAKPRGFLFSVPANIISSILSPRRLLALCSPSTQRTASETLLLPLPFGPTTAVTPGLNSSFTFSGKDLKPCKSNRFKYIHLHLIYSFRSAVCRQPWYKAPCRAPPPPQREKISPWMQNAPGQCGGFPENRPR